MATSSPIHSTTDFIWSENDSLGSGAYGDVYKAIHRVTGKLVAVKTFNAHSIKHVSAEIKARELDVLRKLNHDNIVRLLAVQKDIKTNQQVLITELCTGGSLYSLLDDPENRLGMEETEFVFVLRDLASGMEHLRAQGVVHRDIKPGNIMRYITEDGRSIYKLIDFGAARELENEAEFLSLVGTPEYLLPDMYECAMLKRQNTTHFNAAVDLWSIGVTLYHVASGTLPFQPFEGSRKNPDMMHTMSTKKEAGVISGVQRIAGGPIEWSRELPKTCRLSLGLQALVTPLLADLLQPKQELSLPFQQFFDRAAEVSRKKVVYAFDVNACTMLHVYCDPDTQFSKFQDLITAQTDIPASNQILIYENHMLNRIVQSQQTVESYPGRIPQHPIFLLGWIKNSEDQVINLTNPLGGITIDNRATLDMDVAFAKNLCTMAYNTRRFTSDVIDKQKFICKAMKMYLLIWSRRVEAFRDRIVEVALRVAEIEKRLQLFADSQYQLASATAAVSKLSEKKVDIGAHFASLAKQQDHFLKLKQHMEEMTVKGEELVRTVEHKLTDGVSSLEKSACQDDHNCLAKLDIIIMDMRATMEVFVRQLKEQRTMAQLPLLERNIHTIDKGKLSSNLKKAVKQFETHCFPKLQEIFKRFLDWYRQVEQVQNKMRESKEETEIALTRVKFVTRELDQKCEERNKGMKTVMSELNIEVVALVDMSRSFSQVDFSHTGEGSNLFEFRLKKRKPRQSTDSTSLPSSVAPSLATDISRLTVSDGHSEHNFCPPAVNNDEEDQGTLRFDEANYCDNTKVVE